METKPLLYGLIGFFMGGMIVSLAATAFNSSSVTSGDGMSMSAMTAALAEKDGDAYDQAFIDYMIEHHQAAIDMAKLSDDKAKHGEIKQLSQEILAAQSKEIEQMQTWRNDWSYKQEPTSHDNH
jgi:uncharacterized protein (DUF305 family)